jgi:hypothetical protein
MSVVTARVRGPALPAPEVAQEALIAPIQVPQLRPNTGGVFTPWNRFGVHGAFVSGAAGAPKA